MSSKEYYEKVCSSPSSISCTDDFCAGDKIVSCHTRKKYEIAELGIMHPEEEPTDSLYPGQVGYIACNMKVSSEGSQHIFLLFVVYILTCEYSAHIGDTLHRVGAPVDAMPGFKPSKAMVRLRRLQTTLSSTPS